jgi:tRNA A-37 threonylcarbamoyl transferase component Bud32
MPFGQCGIIELDISQSIVTKKPRRTADDNPWSNVRREYSLSREILFMNHLKDGGFTPKVLKYSVEKSLVCGHPLNIVREIQMEYLGPSLWDCYEEGYLIAPSRLLKDVLEACVYLQDKGVIHFDIKSNNITFCLTSGKAKLIDFGLSEFTAQDVAQELKIMPMERKANDAIYMDEDFGRVLSNNTLFYQNKFHHAEGGKVRLSIEVNHPLFRDPTLLCADQLQVTKGLSVDYRADVYSAGASILYYTGWMQDAGNLTSAEECLKHLDGVRYQVGALSTTELLRFRSQILHAARICGRTDSFDMGLYRAMECKLCAPPNFQGMLECSHLFSEIYGRSFSKCLRRAMHPVSGCRGFARECLDILGPMEESSLKPFDGKTSLAIFSSPSGAVVGQIRARTFCIVSVCIGRPNKLIWCNGILNVESGTKRALLKVLHDKLCECGKELHVETWFKSLDRSSRLEKNLFDEYPMFTK